MGETQEQKKKRKKRLTIVEQVQEDSNPKRQGSYKSP
jgi:hypothetical protein